MEEEVMCNVNLTIYPFDPERPFTGKFCEHQIMYDAFK